MSEDFLRHVRPLLLEQGIGKARKTILVRQLEKHGGQAVATLSEDPTHILVGKNTRLARVPVLLKVSSIPETVSVLRADWLSACLTKRELVAEESYRVHPESPPPVAKTTPVTPSPVKGPGSASQPPANRVPTRAGSSPATSQRTEKGLGEGGENTSSMAFPKAGMSAVTSRRWKKSPKKGKEDGGGGWGSSDSDYVESDEEELERKEGEER